MANFHLQSPEPEDTGYGDFTPCLHVETLDDGKRNTEYHNIEHHAHASKSHRKSCVVVSVVGPKFPRIRNGISDKELDLFSFFSCNASNTPAQFKTYQYCRYGPPNENNAKAIHPSLEIFEHKNAAIK